MTTNISHVIPFVDTPEADRIDRTLRKQIQVGYWPGFIIGMYPSQYAYARIEPRFQEIWRDVPEINLYLHMPFCKWSCTFCTFFKVVSDNEDLYERYVTRLCEQLRYYATCFDRPPVIRSICFGGGTPNAIPASHYTRIFATLDEIGWIKAPDLEPSMEMSPEILTEEYLATVAAAGVKRVSLGLQSLKPELRRSVRRTGELDAHEVFRALRRQGLNINIDLINGLRGQDDDTFMDTLVEVVKLAPETISVYLLSGMNSSLFRKYPELMTTREKYDLFTEYYDYLGSHGYRCESHVKWVREGTTSTHQQKIFEYQGTPTLGVGCGGRSYNEIEHYSMPWHRSVRSSNQLIEAYITSEDFASLPWWGFTMTLDENRRRAIIYGFFCGDVDLAHYIARFGTNPLEDYPAEFAALVKNGLVVIGDGHVRSTTLGTKYTDLIGSTFWSEPVKALFDPARPEGHPEDVLDSPDANGFSGEIKFRAHH